MIVTYVAPEHLIRKLVCIAERKFVLRIFFEMRAPFFHIGTAEMRFQLLFKLIFISLRNAHAYVVTAGGHQQHRRFLGGEIVFPISEQPDHPPTNAINMCGVMQREGREKTDNAFGQIRSVFTYFFYSGYKRTVISGFFGKNLPKLAIGYFRIIIFKRHGFLHLIYLPLFDNIISFIFLKGNKFCRIFYRGKVRCDDSIM